MSDRNDAVSLVLTDENVLRLVILVRKELRMVSADEDLDQFAALLTDINTQWYKQVVKRVGQ